MTAPKLRFPEFKDDWATTSLRNVLTRVSNPVEVEPNSLYREIGIRSHGKGIFHKEPVTGKSLGNKRVFHVASNLFVVNIVFAWERAIAVTSEYENGMIASHRFPMFSSVENKSNVHYFREFFITPKGKYLLTLASPGGAGRNKTLGQSNFENLKFEIPSQAEQNKIANFLAAINQKIALLEEKHRLLILSKEGLMHKIFKREIKFKNENNEPYREWSSKRLNELGSTFSGLSGKSAKDFGQGKPYISYKQIFANSRIDVDKCQLVAINPGEKQNKVRYGDAFFTTSSETPKEIAFCSVLLDEVEEMYLNSFCFGFRFHSFDLILPEFARFLFFSEEFRAQVIPLAQGSTRYNISKSGFLKINIKLPCLEEQIKIANFLSAIDKTISNVQKQLELTNQYKQGLTQQMFV